MAKEPDRQAPPPTAKKERRFDPLAAICLAIIAVSLCLSFVRLLEAEPLGSANDKSRWCTVWALVERGTYQIDEVIRRPQWDTIDKVRLNDHFYSTKPPLFSTLVAGLYWLEKQMLGWTLDDNLAATVRLLLVFVNLIPWGIALWWLSRMIRRYASSPVTVVLVTVTAAFGTLLTPFLTTLNNHVPAAICVIIALDAAMRITLDGDRRWWWFSLCGFFAALAVCNELPAAAFGAAIFGLLVWKERQPTLSYFLPAALLPIAAFFITNAIAIGGIRPAYMFYGKEPYVYVHEGVPSYWTSPKGIDQAKDSPLTYFLHCTIGHHGLFSLSPILLLSVLGWGIGLRRNAPLRDYLAMGLGLTLIVLGYYLTRFDNYNYGGNSVALRWLLWLLPFWMLPLMVAVDRFESRRWFRGLCLTLLLPSIFAAWYPRTGPWTHPWLYTVMSRMGWIDYSDPPLRFDRPVHSWIYRLPDGPTDPDYWVELASVDANGRTATMTILDGGPELVRQRLARTVLIQRRSSDEQPSQMRFTIDVEAFRSGAPISEFLVWPHGAPAESGRRIAEQILRGLPSDAEYRIPRGGAVMYRQAAHVRADAFECLGAVAAVRRPSTDPQWEPKGFQCQIVVSEEVPFGILKMEKRVTPANNSDIHALQRWAIQRAGKFLPRDGAPQRETPGDTAAPSATNSAAGR